MKYKDHSTKPPKGFKRKSLHKKKSTAKNKAESWRNKGYKARITRGRVQVGTSKDSMSKKGWMVSVKK